MAQLASRGTGDVCIVSERRLHENCIELRLNGGERLSLRRFAPVGKGDRIVGSGQNIGIYLPKSGALIPLAPAWEKAFKLEVADALPVTVKEIETDEELEGYHRLTAFHYRGNGGIGRRVPLIAVADDWELPAVIGFIELSSSFLVNSARDEIMNAPFSDPLTGIGWTRWDNNTTQRFGNSIVRISRCVVFPEMRGIGLAKILIHSAVEYARERWHIGGLRPSFIEITAEMLRYWPFVRSCGFHFVGDTEGNQHRAFKDMRYLLGRTARSAGMPRGGGGILSAQRTYARVLSKVMEDNDVSLAQIIRFLQFSPDKLSDDEWILLHKVFRRPKPTYMRGLTPSAEQFISRRKGLRKLNDAVQSKTVLDGCILEIDDLSLSVKSRPVPSLRGRRVQEAFGIVSSEFSSKLINNLSFSLKKGEVALVSGPSGTGKSLLLRAIQQICGHGRTRGRLPQGVEVTANRKTSRITIAKPRVAPPHRSPIELLEELSLEESLRILASAGLAEAQLFVRPASTLSVGQTYRLSLALAISERPDVLLVDEFCEPLDKYTTIAVCRSIRKAAQDFGLGIIAATCDASRVINVLNPDIFLLLSSSGNATFLSAERISKELRWKKPRKS